MDHLTDVQYDFESGLDLEAGDGDGSLPPVEPPSSGGSGGRGVPAPKPVGRLAAWVPAALMAVFGIQTLLVLFISRSGLGSQGVAWLLAGLFVGSFLLVFVLGARYIAKFRY